MSKLRKPEGCESKRHDAIYSVGLSEGKLVIRMKVVAGRCSVGEQNCDESWSDLLSGKLQNIFLCKATATRMGLEW